MRRWVPLPVQVLLPEPEPVPVLLPEPERVPVLQVLQELPLLRELRWELSELLLPRRRAGSEHTLPLSPILLHTVCR